MKKIIFLILNIAACSVSFAKDIYQQIYDLDDSYYGKNFPTANHVSYPKQKLSIDISYKNTGNEHFSGSEHTVYTEYVFIRLGETSKKIKNEEISFQSNKNYITLCDMNNSNKLLSHTSVFEGINFSDRWIGFNINLYEIKKDSNNKMVIVHLPEENVIEFNMGNKHWVPTIEKDKLDDGRKFYPFYNEEKTLKRLIEMGLCSSIDSPLDLEEKLKNNKKFNINELYLDNQQIIYPLDNRNVVSYNNIAFYLEQHKNYDLSVYMLNKIISLYPNREVAYLNLADAYWGRGDKKMAIQSYQKYVQLMQSSGKQHRIPERVLKRIE